MMDANQGEEVFRIALDGNGELQNRIRAIEEISSFGPRGAVDVLLEIGARATENAQILQAVGSALAVLSDSGVDVSEFDMRNLQRATYDAFCDWG